MKRILLLFMPLLWANFVMAQTNDVDTIQYRNEWSKAFSKEGRRNWRSELTYRYAPGILSLNQMVTAGVRIDHKRTLGLMVGKLDKDYHDDPTDYSAIELSTYFRRYIHLGHHDVLAFYSDLHIGAGYVYKERGEDWIDENTGEVIAKVDVKEGDIFPVLGWQGGLRVRICLNVHVFAGLTLSTDQSLGVHLGVGL